MEGQRYQHPILHRHHIISKTDRVKKLRVKDRPSFLGSIIIVSQRRKETNSFYCTTSLSLWTHILSRTLKHLHFYFFLRAWQRIPAPPFFFPGTTLLAATKSRSRGVPREREFNGTGPPLCLLVITEPKVLFKGSKLFATLGARLERDQSGTA